MEREIARLTRAVVALIAANAPEPTESELAALRTPFDATPPEVPPALREGVDLYLNYRGGYSSGWLTWSWRNPKTSAVCERIGKERIEWEARRNAHVRADLQRATLVLRVRWALDLLDRVEIEDPS